MEAKQVLGPREVYAAICGATTVDGEERRRCESILRNWETEATPGYIDSLLQVASQPHMVEEESRILAAVLAKNAVGSSWRKTLGSREWSRVPEAEKAEVRRRAMACLLEDPSDRVAIQVTLLMANIARFDFPAQWPSLLQELLAAAAAGGGTPQGAKIRALRALKHVIHALRNKRIVADTPTPGAIGMSKDELGPLMERIAQERQRLHRSVEETLLALADMWRQDFGSVPQQAPGWEAAGNRSIQALLPLREALLLLPSWEGIEAGIQSFLESLHAAATTTATIFTPEGDGGDARGLIGSKTFERATQCVLAAMDRNPVDFAAYLPHFLGLYGESALFAMDAATVHSVRSKRRVLVIRFLARAMLCPIYRLSWLRQQLDGADDEAQRQEVQSVWPKVSAADSALQRLLEEPQCSRLVEAIISKYLALTPTELEEWQEEPEQFARAADVEASPEADTPRPCGVALLLCMLVREEKTVADALVRLASRLQSQPRTPEVVLLQEAAYRALGEAFSQLLKLPGVTFSDWFTSELSGLLLPPTQAEEALPQRTLRARALWLLGICCSELPGQLWVQAAEAAVTNLRHPDLVVSLAAFSALVAMQVALLEETEIVARNEGLIQQQPASADMAPAELNRLLQGQQEVANSVAETKAALALKVDFMERQAGGMLELALALEGRLEEIESKVRVLQLVSVTVELLREKSQPFLGVIAAALPKVWTTARVANSEGRETGAVARLHGALMGLLTHLVDRLGSLATQHPGVAQVLLPLLAHGLDMSNPEADTLAEDALKLLLVTLASGGGLSPGLQELLSKVMQVLGHGKDIGAALPVLEAYLLLGDARPEQLQPHLAGIAAALERVVTAAAAAVVSDGQAAGKGDMQRPPISKETIAEATAAASMSTLLLQLGVDPSPFAPALRGMAMVVSRRQTAAAAPGMLAPMLEGFAEVLARLLFVRPTLLQALLGGDLEAERRLLDSWLQISSRRSLAEVLGEPRAAAFGRLRRHLMAASLCQLLVADASSALREPPRAARALALCLRVLEERPTFEADQAGIEEVLQQHASGAEVIHDAVLARRLALTQADGMRRCDMRSVVPAAAAAAAARIPRGELENYLALLDSNLPSEFAQLLGGGDAAVGLPQRTLPATEAMT